MTKIIIYKGADMEKKTIEMLYEYGKRCYYKEIELNIAIEKVAFSCPDIAKSSIKTYINNFSDLINGRSINFNTSSKVILYYVENMIKEKIVNDGLRLIATAKKTHVSGSVEKFRAALDSIGNTIIRLTYNYVEQILRISNFIYNRGYIFDISFIKNFYLSLKTKPFVILAGISGTGKSKLVRLFAEAVGATEENGQFALIPVKPDWSDSSDLLGHHGLDGKFKNGALTEFIDTCWKNPDKPYFLCLDEMNLARVEYYFSDFLSVLENRCKNVDSGNDTPIEKEHSVSLKYYPNNLYVIGTVNMDETTFPFSKKVLDRANTIEFSTVNLSADNLFNSSEDENSDQVSADDLPNNFFKSDYYLLKDVQVLTKNNDDIEFVKNYCNELENINKTLERANCHVGYRVRDEIIYYMLYNRRFNLLQEGEAFDNSILQKILPRIQGSNSNIKDLLIALFDNYFALGSGYKLEELFQENSNIVFETCKYPKCAEKIAFMYSKFESDGFTSFWI